MAGGTLYNADAADTWFTGVAIDSRTVRPGELFVAVRGEKHDGHDYIRQAIERGAVGVLSDVSYPSLDEISRQAAVVTVKDTHEAMMILAEKYRETCPARFIGITGSNGKTTTKELAYQLIHAVEPHVYRSPGNFNNLFGMPLALFAMPPEARVAVMEMGISLPGEMTRLTRIVKPDIIAVTNVGPSHLQFLTSVEGVARAKLEMVTASRPDVPVIVNADSPVLMNEARKIRDDLITFGVEHDATFRPERVESDARGGKVVSINGCRFRLALFGRHQIYNLLAAFAIFKTLGYDCRALDTETILLESAPMRGEELVSRDITIIADCYNANPDSVRSALESFEQRSFDGRRVLILGDMLELGENEAQYHRDIGRQVAAMHSDLLILIGPRSEYIEQQAVHDGVAKARILHFDNAEKCASVITDLLRPGDLVLIKGSRGIGLERVIDAWKAGGTD